MDRDRLLRLERQERARAEARAVMDGVAETVALSRARGAAILAPPGRKGARAKPYQRQTGLEWLARKGRLTAQEAQAGERYGAAYRRAKLEPTLPSTLAGDPQGGPSGGPSLKQLVAHARRTVQATEALASFRRRLSMQPDMIAACDAVCGEEQTPREAAGGDREAGRLEAVLKVALHILAEA